MTFPEPYGYGLAKIKGPAGFLIKMAQLFAGRWSKWQHAFLILPDGIVLEAEPGGAKISHIDEYLKADGSYDCRFVYPAELTEDQKDHYASLCSDLEGTPYSFLDYFSLILLHLHIRPWWVTRAVKATGHQICSQLVDYVFQEVGVHLFEDGRFNGDVMPCDLDHLADVKGW